MDREEDIHNLLRQLEDEKRNNKKDSSNESEENVRSTILVLEKQLEERKHDLEERRLEISRMRLDG